MEPVLRGPALERMRRNARLQPASRQLGAGATVDALAPRQSSKIGAAGGAAGGGTEALLCIAPMS